MATASSEAQRRSVRNLARILPLSSVLPVLLAQPAVAATWELVPTLSVGAAYTDNVTLAPAGQESSDFVTQVMPGFNFRYFGPKLKFQADYKMELLYSSQTSDLNTSHIWTGGTLGSMELVDRFLYLDTNSNVSQQNVSLLQPLATSNVNRTGNRATVLTSRVSPFIRHEFGNSAIGEARLTYTTVNSDANTGSGMSDSTAPRLDLRLTSGPAYRMLTWNASYFKERIDYAANPGTSRELLAGTIRHLITPQVSAIVDLGYEDSEGPGGVSGVKGPYWRAGFGWNPSPRTDLSATTGRRETGADRDTSNSNFSFRHRMRRLTFNATYTEDVTDTRSQLLASGTADTVTYLDSLFLSRYPDPIQRQQAVQDYINQNGLPPTLVVPVEFFSTQLFLSKQWLIGVGYQGIRNVLLANYYARTSTSEVRATAGGAAPVAAVGAGDFATSSVVKQDGASATWSWRITPFDTSNLTAGVTRSEFPATALETTQSYIRLTLNHQFSPKVTGTINVRRLHSDSNQGTNGTYKENAITAAVGMSF